MAKTSWLFVTFGEVERTETLRRGMEERSLSHGAGVPTFRGTGK